jgi:hypothetical protein
MGGTAEQPGQSKQAQVFSIVNSLRVDTTSPYTFMAHETQGSCIQIPTSNSNLISQLSMGLLLGWVGVSKSGAIRPIVGSKLLTYKDILTIDTIKTEKVPVAASCFLQVNKPMVEQAVRDNLLSRDITNEDELSESIPLKRKLPVLDFAKRYTEDESYRALVVEQLRQIIREDVSSIALNPVFGSLWRAVCIDRQNEARDGLLQNFGASIERMGNTPERAKMKAWLEESYDYAAEIAAIIDDVPQLEKFPCVFLDPTQDWKVPALEADTGNSAPAANAASFTRDELLEIGRSCDYRILRRLGRALTRLTYVESAENVPAHLEDMSQKEVPRLPLALQKPEHKRVFWKILLHLVLPGTKLGARPAALLAALCIRMGIKPLMDAADSEMLHRMSN